jgi:hypothetical protein
MPALISETGKKQAKKNKSKTTISQLAHTPKGSSWGP